MSEFLDHAITIRDIIYAAAAVFTLCCLAVAVAAIQLKRADRKQAAIIMELIRSQQEAGGGNLRNPAHGIPRGPTMKKPAPAENHRNPVYGIRSDRSS